VKHAFIAEDLSENRLFSKKDNKGKKEPDPAPFSCPVSLSPVQTSARKEEARPARNVEARNVMVQAIDFQILDWIQRYMRNPLLDRIMTWLSAIGEFGIVWIVISLLFILNKKKRAYGIMILAGLILGVLTGNVVLKDLFARPRPCWLNSSVVLLIDSPTDYSFPSGHTLSSFTSATIICRYHWKCGIPAFILAGAIAFSRMYLYVHFPSDILGGLILGVILGILTVLLHGKIVRKDLFRNNL
jgi:undecaprenyl-diphosphatase